MPALTSMPRVEYAFQLVRKNASAITKILPPCQAIALKSIQVRFPIWLSQGRRREPFISLLSILPAQFRPPRHSAAYTPLRLLRFSTALGCQSRSRLTKHASWCCCGPSAAANPLCSILIFEAFADRWGLRGSEVVSQLERLAKSGSFMTFPRSPRNWKPLIRQQPTTPRSCREVAILRVIFRSTRWLGFRRTKEKWRPVSQSSGLSIRDFLVWQPAVTCTALSLVGGRHS
jgi:hypothetical protein